MIPMGTGINTMESAPPPTFGDEITPTMLAHGSSLLFNPDLSETTLQAPSLKELPVEAICRRYRGLLIGVEGTIMEQGGEEISSDIMGILNAFRARTRICLMTNSTIPKPAIIRTGIPIATHIPLMPDPRGFTVAVSRHLQDVTQRAGAVLNNQCAMIGSNPMTEGGCTEADIDFIMVNPLAGKESAAFKLLRGAGRGIIAMHDIARNTRRGQLKEDRTNR